MAKWTQDEEAILIKNYKDVKTIGDLVPLIPAHPYNSIKAKLNSLGYTKTIEYTKDESFFDEPNILNSWAAGLIASDGCIIIKPNGSVTVTIGLQKNDAKLLCTLKEITKFTGPIIYSEKVAKFDRLENLSQIYTISFYGAKHWAEKLKEHWNITPRKSLTIQPPNITDDNMILAYICGLIDGDGGAYIMKYRKSGMILLRVGVWGYYDLINWVRQQVIRISGVSSDASVYTFRNTSRIMISMPIMIALWTKIQSLQIPHMERKWSKISFAMDIVNGIKNNTINREKFDELYDNFALEYEKKYNKPLNKKISVPTPSSFV